MKTYFMIKERVNVLGSILCGSSNPQYQGNPLDQDDALYFKWCNESF